MTVEQLQALVAQVEEAQGLLSRKDEVEREIADAERRRDRILGALSAAEHDLAVVQEKITKQSVFFEHEKRRYTLHLDEHQKSVDQQARDLDEKHQAAIHQAKNDQQAFLATMEVDRRTVEQNLAQLRKEHLHLKVIVADLKHRIGTLPS